jgi:hypothetical protein
MAAARADGTGAMNRRPYEAAARAAVLDAG